MIQMMLDGEAISERNALWKHNKDIPSWVNFDKVELDQFYTKNNVAHELFEELKAYITRDGIHIEDCIFIEPSAGDGSFFNLLPNNKRIGLDIYPMCEGVERQEFLSWNLPKEYANNKIVFVGNPPFGYRAWLALVFMNHAAKFADYIGFILPMAFQSDGKGSPKLRVTGMQLKTTKLLNKGSFYVKDEKLCNINALWQIWKKGTNTVAKPVNCDDYVEIFTVDERKERLCGQEKKKRADYFLQRTYFNEQPTLVNDFSEVKYVCGYGIIIKRDREKISQALSKVDWDSYSNLAAHNCRHISMYHIQKALADAEVISYD